VPERVAPVSLPLNIVFQPPTGQLGIDTNEVIGLALIAACGSMLSWFCAYHPASLPFWAPWDFSWVEYLAVVLSLWWFHRGVRRSSPEERPPLWR
jgi:putative membrane protein